MQEIKPVEQELEVMVKVTGDTGCVSLFGRLDGISGISGASLEQKLRDTGEPVRRLILDLRGIEPDDTTDPSEMLADWTRAPLNSSIQLILVRVPHHMRRPLEQAGLDRELPITYGSLVNPGDA
jgi:anti-anti-sigma regulatory factor